MSASPSLHPSVREHREPRISANALAQYLVLRPDGQETIVHNARFSRPPIVTANGDAIRGLCAYNSDPRRDIATLERVKAALYAKAAHADLKPRDREEARRCIEAITLFERYENALGLRGMPLSECPRLEPLVVEGVTLSIRPHFLVHGDGSRIGAGIIRVAKTPDPDACKLDDTRQRRGDERREMSRYTVAMLQLLLEAQGGSLGVPARELCFVADVRLGERIDAAPDHTVRVRAVRGACSQIARAWHFITPRNSVLNR
ncbi:hypothetical protein OCOJLMKI_5127 [Methylobacterium iners]|uniref:Uncharacterized protein n=1 Tax=Methylobacterium iners TaxID=418707 RepID=A0ABQ4S5W5_9HYPH|nr:hypothetical protein OCOJLMKI_5127 [Methylobacterium iners]